MNAADKYHEVLFDHPPVVESRPKESANVGTDELLRSLAWVGALTIGVLVGIRMLGLSSRRSLVWVGVFAGIRMFRLMKGRS